MYNVIETNNNTGKTKTLRTVETLREFAELVVEGEEGALYTAYNGKLYRYPEVEFNDDAEPTIYGKPVVDPDEPESRYCSNNYIYEAKEIEEEGEA